jgi:hypothetical protein
VEDSHEMSDPIPCECATVATNIEKFCELQLFRKEWKKFIGFFYLYYSI